MAHALPRKLRNAFVIQFVLACLAVVLGVGALVGASRGYVAEYGLRSEAEYFWEHTADGLDAPNTRLFLGFYLPAGASAMALPENLRGLPPGFHSINAAQDSVLVDSRPAGRLYLVLHEQLLVRLLILLSTVPLAMALLAIGVISWLTYRTTTRMVEPVTWLAREVSRWDPSRTDDIALSSERFTLGNAGFEANRLALAFHGLRQRLREFLQRERNFTRDASHELRTPLTVIRVATDLMLADPELGARAQRSLGRIQSAGRDMEAVIDAFLILARENEVSLQPEPFEVRDIVNEEVERIRPMLAGKPVELKVIDAGAPRLQASPQVLRVMLGNLLNNAAQFTERGQIELRLEPDRIEVRDSGIGMAPDNLSRAFEPFYRADEAQIAGKGMGLSIVRRLSERFGWPVTLDSTPGQGTTAVIRFFG